MSKLACSGLEEKKDIGEESSEENNSIKEKEVDILFGNTSNYHSALVEIIAHKKSVADKHGLHGGYNEIFSPPPERFSKSLKSIC